MFLPLTIAMVLYPGLAITFVIFVWKRTSRKKLRWLAIVFAILLPTWDALLSAVVYYTACPLFTKAAIYETAETSGIYYEGDYRDQLIKLDGKNEMSEIKLIYTGNEDFWKGYGFVESQITKIQEGFRGNIVSVSPPLVYRCIPFPETPESRNNYPFWDHKCIPVNEIKSKHVVKTSNIKLALLTIHFVEIRDRSLGRLMGEYRMISKQPYAGTPYYPFFTWLNWHGGIFKANEYVSCPEKSQLFSFQYEVLKAKK